jgi:hypothetical protein
MRKNSAAVGRRALVVTLTPGMPARASRAISAAFPFVRTVTRGDPTLLRFGELLLRPGAMNGSSRTLSKDGAATLDAPFFIRYVLTFAALAPRRLAGSIRFRKCFVCGSCVMSRIS